MSTRSSVKRALAWVGSDRPAPGLSILIYHRVGGGTRDERDLSVSAFMAQMDELAGSHRVVGLDVALDELAQGDALPKVVLTFDDGFADLADPALAILAERQLPFTVYLATAYLGGEMRWDGSTASSPGPALSWAQIDQLAASGLCTFGNHTHDHVRPHLLDQHQLDHCSAIIEHRLGVVPRHFAYPWGIAVPSMEPDLRVRFRSVVTGQVGRNQPGDDPLSLRRIPVRGSDPIEFFRRKLVGRLGAERIYGASVSMAKALGATA